MNLFDFISNVDVLGEFLSAALFADRNIDRNWTFVDSPSQLPAGVRVFDMQPDRETMQQALHWPDDFGLYDNELDSALDLVRSRWYTFDGCYVLALVVHDGDTTVAFAIEPIDGPSSQKSYVVRNTDAKKNYNWQVTEFDVRV